jgi:hypothetical protein
LLFSASLRVRISPSKSICCPAATNQTNKPKYYISAQEMPGTTGKCWKWKTVDNLVDKAYQKSQRKKAEA